MMPPRERPAPQPAAPLRIRRYRAADRAAVRELHDMALQAVGAHAGRGPWDEDLDHIPEVYLRARGEFLVGTLAGRIVAMGALRHHDAATARVARMRVHPELQRCGYGRRVLRRLEARARELGYSRLVLETTPRQIAAIGLYRAEGYSERGRGELDGWEAIFFEKRLRPQSQSDRSTSTG